MSNSKKSVWEQINERVRRKNELKKQIAARQDNVEQFVLDLINEVDEMTATTVNTSLAPVMTDYYIKSLHERLKTLDPKIEISVSWQDTSQGEELPRINGILIKWSSEYQAANNCEAELFVDVASLLFN